MNKGNAFNNAKIKVNSIDWYGAHCTPSLSQQNIILNQIVKKMVTGFYYPERSVFMEEVNNQNLWTFEFRTQESINVPTWSYVGFQRNDRQNDQNLINDTLFRLPIASAQCIIGNEKYHDTGFLLNFDDDDNSQGYHKIEEAFIAFTRDNILPPCISEDDYRSNNDGNNIGYNLHAFDIRYEKNFESS